MVDAKIFPEGAVRFLGLHRDNLHERIALLLWREVSPVNVLADHEGERSRTVALELLEPWLDLGYYARSMTVPAVQNQVLEHRDRLTQAMRLDVSDERLELLALHLWEDFGQRERKRYGHDARRRSEVSSPLQWASRRALLATHRPPTLRAGSAPLSSM
jgi:hypothetical protein